MQVKPTIYLTKINPVKSACVNQMTRNDQLDLQTSRQTQVAQLHQVRRTYK